MLFNINYSCKRHCPINNKQYVCIKLCGCDLEKNSFQDFIVENDVEYSGYSQ